MLSIVMECNSNSKVIFVTKNLSKPMVTAVNLENAVPTLVVAFL